MTYNNPENLEELYEESKTFQVRSEDGSTPTFNTWAEAVDWAYKNEGWKISFSVGNERLRFIREEGKWGNY